MEEEPCNRGSNRKGEERTSRKPTLALGHDVGQGIKARAAYTKRASIAVLAASEGNLPLELLARLDKIGLRGTGDMSRL